MMIISTLDLEQDFRDLLAHEFPAMPIRHTQLSQLSDAELAQAEIVITYGYDLAPEVVRKMGSLQWLHIGQSGMDPLPLDLLQEKKVFITNSRGINSSTIAEYVLCAMLNVVRNTFAYAERARQKIWDSNLKVDELSEKTVGIFGVGSVGKEVAKRAKAFGTRVLGLDIFSGKVPFVDQMFLPYQRQEVLSQCDFIVLSLPLLDSTAGLIGRAELSMMPKTAWIINVGRGPLIDTDALVEAVDAGWITGAVLDVFTTEPLAAADKLWARENIWITPHTAGDHFPQYAPRMVAIIRHNLAKYPHYEQMQNPVPYFFYDQY
ncbi:MAG: D-2-hydroxyacid dehydrogenase [Lentisphaerota bacterium]